MRLKIEVVGIVRLTLAAREANCLSLLSDSKIQ